MQPVTERRQVVGKVQVRLAGIEGLGIHAVEVHRPGGQCLLGQRLIHRAQHEGGRNTGGGARQILLMDGVAPEDPLLIDGLVGAVVDELRGPVGRENDEGHPGELGLGHRGPEVRHRGARGHDHRHRSTASLGQPQRHEPEAALVEVEMTAKAGVGGSSHGERGRAGAGGQRYVAHAEAMELFQQEGRPDVIEGGMLAGKRSVLRQLAGGHKALAVRGR
ncbi:hypothetical protein D3C85_708500 [compost metagenome]